MTGRNFDMLDISWTCPTEDCGEEHGRSPGDLDVRLMQPMREICLKCGAVMRLEYHGEKVILVDHPEVNVRVRTISGVDMGTYHLNDIDIFGYPAPYYPQEVYRSARDGLQRLAATEVEDGLGDLFRRIIFQQYITILETLLHDAILMVVKADANMANEIVLHSNLFTDYKISLKAIAAQPDFIRTKVIDAIQHISWHDFKKVEPVFKAVFDYDLFENGDVRKRLKAATMKRHDIVHRNGKTKDGELIEVSQSDLARLSIDVHEVAEHICEIFEEWNVNHWFSEIEPETIETGAAHEKLAKEMPGLSSMRDGKA